MVKADDGIELHSSGSGQIGADHLRAGLRRSSSPSSGIVTFAEFFGAWCDVWLFDYRASPRCRRAKFTLDDIARRGGLPR
jgi:hypothetical protein